MKLKDKDDKAAYEYSKILRAESAESDKYLHMIPEFAGMLDDKSSYVRTRAFLLICNQARWAKDGQLAEFFGRMSALLYDSKPIVVRQCLQALHEVALYRSEMSDMINNDIGKNGIGILTAVTENPHHTKVRLFAFTGLEVNDGAVIVVLDVKATGASADRTGLKVGLKLSHVGIKKRF